MPFRIPFEYAEIKGYVGDRPKEELDAYIQWLEAELATAKASREARFPQPKKQKEDAK